MAEGNPCTCLTCELTHRRVEAGGIYFCPNPLCRIAGAAWFRCKLKSYKASTGDMHTVDPDEWVRAAYEYPLTDPAIIEARDRMSDKHFGGYRPQANTVPTQTTCERCEGTGDGQRDPVEGTLTCEKCHGSGCASKPPEVTPEQRKALRETGTLFFGTSGQPEIRNADHTVCITLTRLLDALDAKDAKISTLLDERAHETTMEASKSREVKNYLLWVMYAYEKYQRRVCLTMKKVEELVGRPIEAIDFDDYDTSIEVRAKDGIPLTQDEQKKVGQALGLLVWSDNRSPRSLEMKNRQLLAELEAARNEVARLQAIASTRTPVQ